MAESLSNQKISIRFFNDKEVRAAWDFVGNRWLFSVVDVVAALTDSKDPRNYWKVRKHRLSQSGSELVTRCNQLKLVAPDGKRYLTDCLPQNDLLALVELIPTKHAIAFVRWLVACEDQIDSKSREKAYQLWDSSLLPTIEIGTTRGLQQIHAYLFGGLYEFAGQIRQKNIAKNGFQFAVAQFLGQTLSNIERMPESSFDEIVDKYVEMNIAHPFMEGNGRSIRIWLDLILKRSLHKCIDWSKIDKFSYMNAMKLSPVNSSRLKKLLSNALTDRINDREMFMKGIDYSYYYEQND